MNRTRTKKRSYTSLATPEIKRELAQLLEPSQSAYRLAMTSLGRHLGEQLRDSLGRRTFAVVTTPEDADFLTRGMLERLPNERALLACYWTERLRTPDKKDAAAVVQEYVQPMPRRLHGVVIAKSIISSGCIIRTNLEKFLTTARPERIFIAAPVMLEGADKALRAEFDSDIAKRFEFVTFAVDTKRDEKTKAVVPGVGGWVEKRLGLERLSPRSPPALVRERIATMALSA